MPHESAAVRHRPVCPGADEPPAARTKLRLVPVQAGPDAVDVRNLGAVQAKRVACTRLSPFRRVGLCCRRQHQDRKRAASIKPSWKSPDRVATMKPPKATPLIRTLNRAVCLQKNPAVVDGAETVRKATREKTPLDWIMPRFAKPGSA